MKCVDKGDIVGTHFLDFRKAFDLIGHSIFINKLSSYKFRDDTLKLFASYILVLHQLMLSKNSMTKLENIKLGVPQESILGPTLALIFLNYLYFYGALWL